VSRMRLAKSSSIFIKDITQEMSLEIIFKKVGNIFLFSKKSKL